MSSTRSARFTLPTWLRATGWPRTRDARANGYTLGHRNMALGSFLELVAESAGRPAPRVKIPYAAACLAGEP